MDEDVGAEPTEGAADASHVYNTSTRVTGSLLLWGNSESTIKDQFSHRNMHMEGQQRIPHLVRTTRYSRLKKLANEDGTSEYLLWSKFDDSTEALLAAQVEMEEALDDLTKSADRHTKTTSVACRLISCHVESPLPSNAEAKRETTLAMIFIPPGPDDSIIVEDVDGLFDLVQDSCEELIGYHLLQPLEAREPFQGVRLDLEDEIRWILILEFSVRYQGRLCRNVDRALRNLATGLTTWYGPDAFGFDRLREMLKGRMYTLESCFEA